MPERQKTYDVFLSFNSKDRDAVRQIANYLVDVARLHPWFDEWDLSPGEEWIDGLYRGLEASTTCAIFVGKNGEGPWQKREIRAALQKQTTRSDFRLIPVLLPGTSEQPQLPPFLKAFMWVDLQQNLDDSEGLRRLVCGIRGEAPGRLGTTGGKTHEPPPPSSYPLCGNPLCEGYLKKLFSRAGFVPLAEIAPENAEALDSPPTLDAIYTALLTSSPEEQRHIRVGSDAPEDRKSALEQVNDHQFLVILGDPGSGKSTFVNFLALCLAGEWLQDPEVNLDLLTRPLALDEDEERQKPQPWRHGALLPVHIVLREFAASLPTDGAPASGDHLWQFLAAQLQEEGRAEFVEPLRQHLLKHGGLFLLDGLDEAPETEQVRPQIKRAVEGLAHLFSRCHILVTSRTYAYQQKDWKLADFAETRLSTFTDAQIRTFIRHWYAFISQSRGMNAQESQARADDLHEQIRRNARLQELAERPILLTLIASLHASHRKLPDRRVELYQETVKLLLRRWEWQKVTRITARGEVITERQSLLHLLETDQDKILELLGQLAYQAHAVQPLEQKDAAYIDGKGLIFGLRKLAKGKASGILGEQIEHYLQNRAGILVAPDEGIYTFPHRSFQEYLAAKYLYEQDDYPAVFPDNIAELARKQPNRWREVVFLAAALGRSRDMWDLVDALCQHDIQALPPSAEDAWGALLAGQSIVDTIDLEEARTSRRYSKIQRIQHWLAAILDEQAPFDSAQGAAMPFPSVERALAGRLLAVLGDPRPGVGCRPRSLSGVEGSIDLPDIEWREIPAGTFLMGSDPDKDPDTMSYEKPQHKVTVQAFEMSRYPITNAQYQAFVNDGGYTEKWRKCWSDEGWKKKEENDWDAPRRFHDPFGFPNHPVVGVSWYEAMAFCQWLTIKTSPPTPLRQERGDAPPLRGYPLYISFS